MSNVQIITSRQAGCGISEHTDLLLDAVYQADPGLSIEPVGLDPKDFPWDRAAKVVHLNYHAALHSQWTPLLVEDLQRQGQRVVITYHDTGVPNSEQCLQLYQVADAFVVHEPAEDLPYAHYWRQGVPDPPPELPGRSWSEIPVLGTVGHDFGWKCWDRLAEITKEAGWGLLLCTPTMSVERELDLQQKNPRTVVQQGLSTPDVIQNLRMCAATAFTFVTHNTGQSASILLGIAAHRPVIAFHTCRQFRALWLDPLGKKALCWVETFEEVRTTLAHLGNPPLDAPAVVQLAAQESWRHVGKKYASLYRSLL